MIHLYIPDSILLLSLLHSTDISVIVDIDTATIASVVPKKGSEQIISFDNLILPSVASRL